MLRVLHCIYDDPKNPWVAGGGSLRVYEIYRRLAPVVDVTVATGSFPGAENEDIEGIRYIRLGAQRPYAWSRWTFARAASALLHRSQYDVALLDFSAYTPILIPYDRPVGIVVHMLHSPTARRRWSGLIATALAYGERAMLRRARCICTTSRWMMTQLQPLIDTSARVALIGSGVPDEFWGVERHERSYLLYYGRYDTFHKGLDVLLDAFTKVTQRDQQVELWLAGRGKDAERVRLMADDLNLGARVRVWEDLPRAEVLSLMAGALMLVMPSRLEGLPMVPAEAMAAGVPVIATDVGAVAEVVDPPRGGVLVPPNDPAALADAITLLLREPARRAAISRSARLSAQRFSWESVAQEHLAFLNEVAATPGASRNTRKRPR